MIYGYARVSTEHQVLVRQVENILKEYPSAKIYAEKYTGTKIAGREELDKLVKVAKAGDTIVFDAVDRMSRNAEEGIALYETLMERGVELVFLKQHFADTATYKSAMQFSLEKQGETIIDMTIDFVNSLFKELRRQQIKSAFESA